MTDKDGFVEIDVRQQMTSLSGQFPWFNGFFLFEGGPKLGDGGLAFYSEVYESSRPWLPGDYGFWGDIPIAYYAPYFKQLNLTYDPTLAYYQIQPFDCRQEPAKGVTVEIHVFDGTAFRPCDTCTKVAYSNDADLPDPALTGFSSLGQIAYVSGPIRQSIVVLRDEQTRRAVAAISLFSLPGHFHVVGMMPPSKAQLADFPPSVL